MLKKIKNAIILIIGDNMDIVKRYMKKLFMIINKDEMKILPGHLAFFMVLSLIPSITLIGIICNKFGLSNTDVLEFFREILPIGVVDVIHPFIESSGSSIALIYLIISFILVSNGVYAIISTTNTLYQITDSNQLKGRIKAIILTILLMFLFVFILIVLAFGNMIVSFVLNLEILENLSDNIYHLFVYIKWPIAFFIIYIILKLIYTLSPDKEIKSKTVTKGAIFTTIGWLTVTAIYSYYANNVARYDLFYGNLSNIVILMMWIYIVAYIFAIGIAINVNNYNYMEENVINNEDKKDNNN